MQFTSAFTALLLLASFSSVIALPSPNVLATTEATYAVLMDKRTGLPVPRIAKRADPSVADLINSCPKANSKRLDPADVCSWSKTGSSGEFLAQSVAEEGKKDGQRKRASGRLSTSTYH